MSLLKRNRNKEPKIKQPSGVDSKVKSELMLLLSACISAAGKSKIKVQYENQKLCIDTKTESEDAEYTINLKDPQAIPKMKRVFRDIAKLM